MDKRAGMGLAPIGVTSRLKGSKAEAASIREHEDQSDAPHADEGRLHHVRWREVLDGGRGTPGAFAG
jgi:hypothetical protein